MKSRNKKTKMIDCAALVLSGVLLLSACENPSSIKNEQESIQKKRVTVITKSTTSFFWKSVYSGANAASSAYNMELVFEGPESEEDFETQNEMIRKAAEDGTDAIVFSAVDYRASTKAVDEAAMQGVKIVVIDSDVESDHVECRIGTDNYTAGCMAGKAILDGPEEVLNIGIINFDVNTQNGQERERGFRDTVLKDDRANIVAAVNVLSSEEAAKNDTIQMLQQYPQINAVVTFNEWTSLGVGYAIQELEAGDRVKVVAFDNNTVSVGMLETGEVDALVVQNPYAMGYLGVEAAYRLVNGYELDNTDVDTATITVTRETMYSDESQKALFLFE